MVFEAAAVLGIPLFNSDKDKLDKKIENLNDKMALLPKIIRSKKKKVKDDF